jgi:hypothetical protein
VVTGCFYAFTTVNLPVAMFFAFVVVGFIYGVSNKNIQGRFDGLAEENPFLFSSRYAGVKGNIYHTGEDD